MVAPFTQVHLDNVGAIFRTKETQWLRAEYLIWAAWYETDLMGPAHMRPHACMQLKHAHVLCCSSDMLVIACTSVIFVLTVYRFIGCKLTVLNIKSFFSRTLSARPSTKLSFRLFWTVLRPKSALRDLLEKQTVEKRLKFDFFPKTKKKHWCTLTFFCWWVCCCETQKSLLDLPCLFLGCIIYGCHVIYKILP